MDDSHVIATAEADPAVEREIRALQAQASRRASTRMAAGIDWWLMRMGYMMR